MGKGNKFEEYVNAYYAALRKSATYSMVDGVKRLVFTGSLTKIYDEAVGNPHYYTKIRSVLVKTDSIDIIAAGNRGRPSEVILCHEPPPKEMWPEDLTGALPAARILSDADRRLKALEGWRETTGGINIAEVLREYEQRITALEAKVGNDGKTT